MKFLCLHGAGTSGAIFKAQTAAFRAQLPPGRHTFDFIDGPYELPATTPSASSSRSSTDQAGAAAAQPVSTLSIFPPPYYTFLRSYTDQAELDAAPEHVLAHIRREVRETGRAYDACLCFSQGAAVVAGLLMKHNVETEAGAAMGREERRRSNGRGNSTATVRETLIEPTAATTSGESDHELGDTFLQQQKQHPPPFKAVLFICGGPPMPILESLIAIPPAEREHPSPESDHYYYKIPQKAWDLSDATGADLVRKTRLMGERFAQIMARGGGSRSSPEVGDVKNRSTGSTTTTNTIPRTLPKFDPWDDISTLPHDAASILARQDQRELPCSFALNPSLLEHSPQSQPPPSITSPDVSRNSKSTFNSAPQSQRILDNRDESLADVYGLDLRHGSLPKALRILGIPTAHVYGAKDPRYSAAIQLALMCDPECRRVYDTRGGHEIPRDKAVSQEIADMIAWLEEEVSRKK